MRNTNQTANQSIAAHGLSVWKHTLKLLNKDYEGYRLPKWWDTYSSQIYLNLHEYKTIKHYTIWHDCGKPSCYKLDEEGKPHFPNHAEISYQTFLSASTNLKNSKIISNLIRNDMKFHKPDDGTSNSKLSTRDICTLVLVSLAELHSNAKMFGGINSDSFKIKFKKWEKLTKAALVECFDKQYVMIFVDSKLSTPQKVVQASHAAIESARNFMDIKIEHPSVITFAVDDLKRVIDLCESKKFSICKFNEPLFDNALTAIATQPLSEKDKRHFSSFGLLKA